MVRKKKKEDLLDRMIAKFSLRGLLLHPATLYLASSATVVGVAIASWHQYNHRILDLPGLRLTDEKIAITQPPAWANVDLKRVVMGDTGDGPFTPPSVMDTSLIPTTVDSLKSIGWIENVDRVEKSRSGLSIDLTYRHPVAMVEMSKENVVGFQSNRPVLLHVDRNGVAMGKGLSTKPGDYLLISIGQPMYTDQLRAWSQWQDPRIQEAASICDALQQDWKPMGLHRIVTFRRPNNPIDRRIPYELWTERGQQKKNGGVHVVWGNAAGNELPNEANAVQKLAAMKNYIAKHGSFDKLTDRVLDVRSGTVVELGARQGRLNQLLSDLK